MTWFLQRKDKDKFRYAAVFTEGKPLVVGRASTADVPVSRDDKISSEHVRLEIVDGQCRFIDLDSTNGCFLNDERLSEGMFKPGDLLRCGETNFRVESAERTAAQGDSDSQRESAVANPSETVKASDNSRTDSIPEALSQCEGFVAEIAAEVVSLFELGEVIRESPSNGEHVTEFTHRLLSSDEPTDGLKFMAYALPKRLGVWWAVKCIQSEDGLATEPDAELLEVVSEWVAAPDEKERRKAMQLAEKMGMKTPAAWAAAAAFWSHGSISAEGQPEIPAQDNMTGKAVAGAATLASVVQSPERAPERREAFVKLAHQIIAGELPWESE